MNRRDLWLRVRALFLRRRVERELDEELAFHLEMQARKNKSPGGVTEEDARRQARVKFGNVGVLAEQCRDQRGVQFIDSLIRDTGYALRQLRLTPLFTLIGVLSLALGIGANTALFTVFDTLYLRKLAVPQPDDLVSFRWRAFGAGNPLAPTSVYGSRMGSSDPETGRDFVASTSFSSPIFEEFRNSTNVPAEVFGFSSLQASAVVDGWPRDVSAQLVSGNYFGVLGATTIAGRPLESSDDDPRAEPAAVISSFAWETLFGSDRSAIGRKVVINGLLVTIVGVTPRAFHLGDGTFPAFTLPMALTDRLSQGNLTRPGVWWLRLMARKTPGVTIQQVETSLQGVFEGHVITSMPQAGAIAREQIPQLVALPGSRGFVEIQDGRSEAFLLTVATVFALLLLIVCLNLANLLTARGVSREYEIGMRLALGASRVRLIRQLVTESVLLALMGGAAGIVVSFWGKEMLRAYFGQQELSISWRVLAFNIVVAGLTGLLFGLAPAFRATRSSLNDSAKRRAGNLGQPKALLNKSLVVIQVAMSVVLLIGAGLLIQSRGNWRRLEMGFNPETMLLFDAPPPEQNVGGVDLFARMVEQIQSVPGVLGVSTAGCFPPSSCGSGERTNGGGGIRRSDARRLQVLPTFFAAAGISVVAGRNFTTADGAEGQRVAIIDEEFARLLFPGTTPLGKRFIHESNNGDVEIEVVGVVRNIVLDVGRSQLRPVLYEPETPAGRSRYGTTFVIRIASDPERIVPMIRGAVAEVDSKFPIFGMTTFKQLVERDLSRQRQLSTTWTFFGASALLLTAIGLYGLMAYTVSRRVNEIGIRIALGATRLNVIGLVMRQISRLIVIGLGAGFVLSLGLNQAIRAYVFGVELFDFGTLMAVAAIVVTVTAIASYVPARIGARIDPVTALRSE